MDDISLLQQRVQELEALNTSLTHRVQQAEDRQAEAEERVDRTHLIARLHVRQALRTIEGTEVEHVLEQLHPSRINQPPEAMIERGIAGLRAYVAAQEVGTETAALQHIEDEDETGVTLEGFLSYRALSEAVLREGLKPA